MTFLSPGCLNFSSLEPLKGERGSKPDSASLHRGCDIRRTEAQSQILNQHLLRAPALKPTGALFGVAGQLSEAFLRKTDAVARKHPNTGNRCREVTHRRTDRMGECDMPRQVLTLESASFAA